MSDGIGTVNDTDFIAALGRVPSGLFVLTVGETGMLASWVQQCSFDPPQVTVAVQRGRPVHTLLVDRAPFALNLLPAGQSDLVRHFGRGFARGQPAFTGLEVGRTAAGAPVLRAALGHLACDVVGRFDAGDHDLIIGRVVGGALHSDGQPAIHIRKNGLKY